MERIQKVIENNKDKAFVVHVKNKEEHDILISLLEKMNYECTIPLKSLREMANELASINGYDGCWRISKEKGIAYHPSIEHWRLYTNDIIEIKNGKLQFHEGDYTDEELYIEANKIFDEIHDEQFGEEAKKTFGLNDDSLESIIALLRKG